MSEKQVDDSEIESVMDVDVAGPGLSQEVKVRPEPVSAGARASAKSKKMLVGAGVGLAAITIFAIAISGNKPAAQKQADVAAQASTVGTSTPPAPPVNFERRGLLSGSTSDASAASGVPASSTLEGENHGLLSPAANQQPVLAQGQQQQHELSPAQKYRQWLTDHKYKMLEGDVLASESASQSSLGDGITAPAASSHAAQEGQGANSGDPLSSLRDFEAKGLAAAQNSLIKPGAAPALGVAQQESAQDKNKDFLKDNQIADDGYLHADLDAARGKYELVAGSVIPSVLVTALDSDLPGFVSATVRETVYDSINHVAIVIPQGSKLVGAYSADVSFGQSRALVVWSRLIYPDGSMIDLKGMAGTDEQGRSGFADQVDNHYLKIFGSSFLISTLSAIAQLSQPQSGLQTMQPTPQQQAAAAMATGMANTGNQLLSKNLGVQPTIKIRAGYLFNVIVNKTMIMPAWKG